LRAESFMNPTVDFVTDIQTDRQTDTSTMPNTGDCIEINAKAI